MRRSAALIVVLVAATLGLPVAPAQAAPGPVPGLAEALEQADDTGSARVLVEYSGDATAVAKTAHAAGGEVLHTYESVAMISVEATAPELERIATARDVTAVRTDVVHETTVADTTMLIGATEFHERGQVGGGRMIAVLDTGVLASHPLLAGAVVEEACFSALGQCPNGGTSQTGPGSGRPQNCAFAGSNCHHGSHVAGIAAARAASPGWFDGVAPGATIASINIFSVYEPGRLGAYQSDILAGLEYVDQVLRARYDVAAVNMSFSAETYAGRDCDATSPDAPVLKPVVDRLRAAGIVSVAAAGNTAETNKVGSPACLSSVVAVGNSRKNGIAAGGSSSSEALDLWAPGSNVVSASADAGSNRELSGTSMAAPHVAGAFALLDAEYPELDVDEKLALLTSTGTPITRAGVTRPRLNLWNLRASAPPAPARVVAKPHDERAAVSWPLVAGADVIGYRVRAIPHGPIVDVGPSVRRAVVRGLDNSDYYFFTVQTITPNGLSAPALSEEVAARPVWSVEAVETTYERDSNTWVKIKLRSSTPVEYRTRISFTTVDVSGGSAAGAGVDYVAADRASLIVPEGGTKAVVRVKILGDDIAEAPEDFGVSLFVAPVDGVLQHKLVRVTIVDDDG